MYPPHTLTNNASAQANINFVSDALVAPFFGASPSAITPLLSAVMSGNVLGAEILLENGANIGGVPVSGDGGSFILLAAAQARRCVRWARLVLPPITWHCTNPLPLFFFAQGGPREPAH